MTDLIRIPNVPVEVPLGISLLAYRGSIAHNMYVPSSDSKGIDDIDLMGVVVGQRKHYFGLQQWGSRGTVETRSDNDPYDCVHYEMRKMFSLLLQGNPNVLSILWVRDTDILFENAAGTSLIENKNLFVGKHVYPAFTGYAYAQLQKMETREPAALREYLGLTDEAKYRGIHPNQAPGETKDRPDDASPVYQAWASDKILQRLKSYIKKGENIGYMGEKRKKLVLEHGYDSKNAAHLIRLLRMCCEFLSDGVLRVFRDDANELLDIKKGKWTLEQIKTHATELFEDAKQVHARSPLPDKPDYDRAETLLCDIVEQSLSI